MSSIFYGHPWDDCRKHIRIEEEGSANLLGFSEECPALCVDLALKTDGSAYKRRKLHWKHRCLVSKEDTSYIATTELIADNYKLSSDDDHCTEFKDKGDLLISGKHCLSSSVELFPNCMPKHTCMMSENFEGEYAASCCCSSSQGNVECSSASADMKRPKHSRKLSVADKEPFEEFTSPMELCKSILKSHGLLGEKRELTASPSELPWLNNPCPKPCKICENLGNPLEMLICDGCEEAFHLSCCSPEVKGVPSDDWYCQACFGKKPWLSLRKSCNIKGEKLSYEDLVSVMLQETESYKSNVRVGKKFQAEVPDWAGPSYTDGDYFDAAVTLPTSTTANGWSFRKSTSIGNWVQCREVIDKDKMIICGKWRRAPLSEVQTDLWDCSCAVTWDPIHADCAVPQELPNSEVQKHLRFVKMVNDRLAAGRLQKAIGPHH